MPNDVETPRFGLKESTITKICDLFSRHPAVQKVVLYGSRAKGNYRNGSDIDLTVFGDELSFRDLGKIESELDDLLLPYKIDLSLFNMISSEELKEHIGRVGVVFFESREEGQLHSG